MHSTAAYASRAGDGAYTVDCVANGMITTKVPMEEERERGVFGFRVDAGSPIILWEGFSHPSRRSNNPSTSVIRDEINH